MNWTGWLILHSIWKAATAHASQARDLAAVRSNLVEEEKAEEFSIKLESKYRAKYQKGAEVYICQESRGAYAEPI